MNALCSLSTCCRRARILRHVRKRYGHQRVDAVMQELDRYTGSVVADRDRVHRAILKLTDGSFENLQRWTEVALYDYRDVLGPAEYPDASTATEVRRFNAWKLDQADRPDQLRERRDRFRTRALSHRAKRGFVQHLIIHIELVPETPCALDDLAAERAGSFTRRPA